LNLYNDSLHIRIHDKEISRSLVTNLISLLYELANKIELDKIQKMEICKKNFEECQTILKFEAKNQNIKIKSKHIPKTHSKNVPERQTLPATFNNE
jgi:phosphatidate phosphatase PAH1